MTDLEWIEEEIFDLILKIYVAEQQIESYIELGNVKKYYIEKKKRIIKNSNEKLHHLQQIKSELETLNILQDKLEFSVIKIDTEEGTKYHLVMKGYNSLISEKEYEAVNKVLEVKDES